MFLVLWIAVWLYAFFDAITTDPARVRGLPKTLWVLLILIFSVFAAIPWFVFGRPRRSSPAGAAQRPARSLGWQTGQTSTTPSPGRRAAPVAPDDNPEFLQQLHRDITRNNKPPKPPRGPNSPGDPDSPTT